MKSSNERKREKEDKYQGKENTTSSTTMKVKALSRSKASSGQRECSGDLRQVSRNLDPSYHPMQRSREYVRAIQAAKIDRMFAKPLIGNLGNGHQDAVYHTAVSRSNLCPLLSGCADGTVGIWDLSTRSNLTTILAHSKAISGIVFGNNPQLQDFYSCSTDGSIRRWSIPNILEQLSTKKEAASTSSSLRASTIGKGSVVDKVDPLNTWRINGTFHSIDHIWNDLDDGSSSLSDTQFVTASDSAVQVWTPTRSTPIQTHDELWGSSDTVNVVRYNPAECHLIANCSMDRGIGLHDLRTSSAMSKTILKMRSNCIEWNPMEPLNFVVGNEDYQAYTFDMRNLSQPTKIYKGHTGAILSVSWSPTGREFVTGSYDRTIRIFSNSLKQTGGSSGVSRDIYHTKRMQRVFTVNYTYDNTYIVSGSDDTNIRLWKANASEKIGQLTTREESSMQYRQALIRKYQHLPQVKQITKSRKVPKTIKKQIQQQIIQKESAERKHSNRIKHSKPGTHQFVAERKKVVVKKVD